MRVFAFAGVLTLYCSSAVAQSASTDIRAPGAGCAIGSSSISSNQHNPFATANPATIGGKKLTLKTVNSGGAGNGGSGSGTYSSTTCDSNGVCTTTTQNGGQTTTTSSYGDVSSTTGPSPVSDPSSTQNDRNQDFVDDLLDRQNAAGQNTSPDGKGASSNSNANSGHPFQPLQNCIKN